MLDPLFGGPPSDPPSSAATGWPVLERVSGDEMLRCVVRHLVVAASELARDPGLSGERAFRYALAESRFRALTDLNDVCLGNRESVAIPRVLVGDGRAVLMTDLMLGACLSAKVRVPRRAIDPELVHAAKELLIGLDWQLPDQPNAAYARPCPTPHLQHGPVPRLV